MLRVSALRSEAKKGRIAALKLKLIKLYLCPINWTLRGRYGVRGGVHCRLSFDLYALEIGLFPLFLLTSSETHIVRISSDSNRGHLDQEHESSKDH